MIFWNDPELWSTDFIDGQSIQSLMGEFLLEKTAPNTQQLMVRRSDECQGANCVGDTSNMATSPCQQFLELGQSFEPVPWYLKWLAAGLVGTFLGHIIRFNPTLFVGCKYTKNGSDSERRMNGSHRTSNSLAMRGLNVFD